MPDTKRRNHGTTKKKKDIFSKGLFYLEFAFESSDLRDLNDPDAYLTEIGVSIRFVEMDDDADEESRGRSVGNLLLYLADISGIAEASFSLAEVMDDRSADAAECYAVIFDNDGEFRPEVADQFDCVFADRLLFVDRIEIDPQYRGYGLGLMATWEAVRCLRGDALVVLKPYPLGFSDSDDPALLARFAAAQSQLRSYCSQLGFRRVGQSEYYALGLNDRMPSRKALLRRASTTLRQSRGRPMRDGRGSGTAETGKRDDGVRSQG